MGFRQTHHYLLSLPTPQNDFYFPFGNRCFSRECKECFRTVSLGGELQHYRHRVRVYGKGIAIYHVPDSPSVCNQNLVNFVFMSAAPGCDAAELASMTLRVLLMDIKERYFY